MPAIQYDVTNTANPPQRATEQQGRGNDVFSKVTVTVRKPSREKGTLGVKEAGETLWSPPSFRSPGEGPMSMALPWTQNTLIRHYLSSIN